MPTAISSLKSAPPSRAESETSCSACLNDSLKSAPPSRAESYKVASDYSISMLKSAPPSRAESVPALFCIWFNVA